MNTAAALSTDLCLCIFDPHQNLRWMKRVMEKESERVTHVVLGGDYFDTAQRSSDVSPVSEVCDYLLHLDSLLGDRLTILLGNHDVHYYEAKRWCAQRRNPPHSNYRCSGYTNNKAKAIAKGLGWDFWRKCRLFQQVNGWLVSHAGVARRHWHDEVDLGLAIEALDNQCRTVVEQLPHRDFAILQPGAVRGGGQIVGGITWLDFEEEFVDDLPLPQIFGHTMSSAGARKKGRSWCVDGGQSVYALLRATGQLEVVPYA